MTIETIAALLREAAKTHHTVYRITDGHDPDWASWYAEWLLTLSELPELLGRRPVRSNLIHALVDLERRFHADPGWEMRYAAHLLDWFGGELGTAIGTGRTTEQTAAAATTATSIAATVAAEPADSSAPADGAGPSADAAVGAEAQSVTASPAEPDWPSFAGDQPHDDAGGTVSPPA